MTAPVDALGDESNTTIEELVNPANQWWLAASCRTHRNGFDRTATGLKRSEQQRICAGCPVRRYCAVDALKQLYETGSLYGIWAGVSGASKPDRVRQALATVAGLPEDHHLVAKTTRYQRRERAVLGLHLRRWKASEIATFVGANRTTVDRALARTGHHSDTKQCASCASKRAAGRR
ncbi:WhiB family transcriptional regulator [Gordonia alkanivorans]|uniref:WhiB family transcriptional regulator n=1 Tax=Gordonia alkanivorans TaxID=84096 RepID=UPI0005A7372F|nr:WhiB family transcriptional regulator [Gordonia alkanivorans]